ncbi:MAG: sensor histidine kinase [Muricoprocola sp.]
MTALYLSHPYIRSVFMMILYLLTLVQIGCVMVSVRRKRRYLLKYLIPVFLFTYSEIVLLRYINEQMVLSGNLPVSKGWNLVFSLPQEVMGLVIALLCVATYYFYDALRKDDRNSLNSFSIKESIDNLPTGLCFSSPGGRVLLTNHRMITLCHKMTGDDLQDAGAFWNLLKSGTVSEGITCISPESSPVYGFPDGTIWSFERKQLHTEDRQVIQITASDITQLYQLSEKLKKNNADLEQMNGRLRRYGENMVSFVRNREILEAKMRIHNEFGQTLLASRTYLVNGAAAPDSADILKRWNYVVALLKKECEPEDSINNWNSFVNAAVSAGVRINLKGELPKTEAMIRLLITAATEALTNAVRHAGADELTIQISHINETLEILFTNNGRKPSGEITPGGGLGSLRQRLEEAGGALRIESQPRFALYITLPTGGKERK